MSESSDYDSEVEEEKKKSDNVIKRPMPEREINSSLKNLQLSASCSSVSAVEPSDQRVI